MLQLIIDAFEEKNKDENFFKSLKKMDRLSQFFIVTLLGGLVLFFIFFMFKKFEWCMYLAAGWIIMTFIATYTIGGRTRKKWKDNILNYNKKLDCLKDILCEKNVNYYSKSKIEKLIDQCEKSIIDLTSEKEKKRERRNRLIEKAILPIIAFGAGVMSQKIGITEVVQICTVAIVIVIITNMYILGFNIFIEEITGNELEKRKYLKGKLEDLLIRDFEVTDSAV